MAAQKNQTPKLEEVSERETVERDLLKLRPDLLNAFDSFLQLDIAGGDPTADTIAAYRREIAAWVRWCEQFGVDPATARRMDVEAYREALKQSGISVSTRRHKLSIIRRFYDAANKYALLKMNPAEGVKSGKDFTLPEDKIVFFAEQALASLLNSIPTDSTAGTRDRAILGLMAIHGLRRVEVHRLNHENLRIEGDLAFLVVRGKSDKLRRVYLREDTFAALQNYAQAKFNASMVLEGAFFVGHGNNGRGHRLSRQALNEIVTKYLEKADLKRDGVACHALRHTFGTLSLSGGAAIEDVRDAMGHTQVETIQLYEKAIRRAKRNPANYINVTV